MIFVTVGTHEQQFDRLIKEVDRLREEKTVDEEVIIQTGYSTYEPKFCGWSRLYSYQEMVRYMAEARIVITHGGPSSFIMPLQIGKVPIVVPRQKLFGEHVNDHQVEFCRALKERMDCIILVDDIRDLGKAIAEHDANVMSMTVSKGNNSEGFNKNLAILVKEMGL